MMVSNKTQLARASAARPSGPPACPHKDLFHRINFSYQASIFLQQLEVETLPVQTRVDRKGKRKIVDVDDGQVAYLSGLARGEMKCTKKMAVHNLLKLYVLRTLDEDTADGNRDPSLKRTICKTCSTILTPGMTSKVRNRRELKPTGIDCQADGRAANKSHTTISHHTCMICSSIRSIPNPPIGPSEDSGQDTESSIHPRGQAKAIPKSKVTFHDRESREAGDKGHKLWRGDTILHDWGTFHRSVE